MPLPEPQTLSALIAAIRRERDLFAAVLARVPQDQMEIPGVLGDWSVKDLLAHIAVWQSRQITMLFQAERSGKPVLPRVSLGTADWDKINAQDRITQKDRPLERVLNDYHEAHVQLLKRLEGWRDEKALFEAKYYATLEGESLASYVWGNSGEHDAEHRGHLESWLQRAS
jgi:hypothetical protein